MVMFTYVTVTTIGGRENIFILMLSSCQRRERGLILYTNTAVYVCSVLTQVYLAAVVSSSICSKRSCRGLLRV